MKKTTTAIATINKDLASAYLDKKGNFTATQYDKETDHENTKLVTNKGVAENSAMICAISEIATMVDKAQCYHLAQIKDSIVKNFGFKGIADYCENNFKQAIGDKSQVSRKRNVGKFFVQMAINPDNTTTYFYRDGIPFDCTISALVECLALLKDDNGEFIDIKKIDIDNLTEDEIAEMVDRLVKEYIEEDRLHLSMTAKHVREEVKKIKGIISDKVEKKQEEAEEITEKDKHDNTRLESVKACIDRISNLLGTNERVADALATILEEAEKTYSADEVTE